MTLLTSLFLMASRPALAQDEFKIYRAIRAERDGLEARRQACTRDAGGDRVRSDACLDGVMRDANAAADVWIAKFINVFAARRDGAPLVRGVRTAYAAMRAYRTSYCWVAGASSLVARPGAVDKFAEAECHLNQTYWFVPDIEAETRP